MIVKMILLLNFGQNETFLNLKPQRKYHASANSYTQDPQENVLRHEKDLMDCHAHEFLMTIFLYAQDTT